MDALSLIMFAFALMLGFVFTLLGFFELKNTMLEKEAASPTMGLIYFVISMAAWISQFFYWFVMSTDPLLQIYSWLWFAFFWVCFTLAMACAGYILKASVNKNKDGTLEIRMNTKETP